MILFRDRARELGCPDPEALGDLAVWNWIIKYQPKENKMSTFAQEAEETYNEMRNEGSERTITALAVDLNIPTHLADMVFKQIENGDPVDITLDTINAYMETI